MRRRVGSDHRVPLGPGDDAAVVATGGTNLLFTNDMLLEGTCFCLAEAGPRRVGRKAMAVNLSDIAAMAGRPIAALVAVGFPRATDDAIAQELLDGMIEMAREFDVALVGGDTNAWDGPLVISVTLVGEPPRRGAVTRAGARPGDWLFVTGPLGGSLSGRHLDFTPRIREALELHGRFELHAMIDISDGFSLDLHRLCQESGCGADIVSSQLPISEAARRIDDGHSPLEHALADGEDFELLFAVPAESGVDLRDGRGGLTFPVYHVGEIVPEGVWISVDGGRQPLPPMGYLHDFGG